MWTKGAKRELNKTAWRKTNELCRPLVVSAQTHRPVKAFSARLDCSPPRLRKDAS